MQAIPLLEEGIILGGKWRVLGHIATGGKGVIYLAEHCELSRKAAVKMISPEFLSSLEDAGEAETEVERFRREMRIMAQIRHPNVVQVFDQGAFNLGGNEYDYYVMEYVPGPTMRQSMPEDGFGSDAEGLRRWLAEVFLPLLGGVEALHAMGVVHRDLKPENVLLDQGAPRIADFGLAGARFAAPVTRSHHVLGTIFYMAPEQFTDMQLADVRMEVYALGKILYEAAVGHMRRDTSFIMDTARLPRTDTELLERLDRIVRRATAKDVVRRIPGVRELRAEIEALPLTPARRSSDAAPSVGLLRRAHGPALLAAVLLLVLSLGFLLQVGRERVQPASGPVTETGPQGDGLRVLADDGPSERPGPGLPRIVAARDGGEMRLVPGGEVAVSGKAGGGKLLSVPAFYLGAAEVTNLQYVDFLNSNLVRIEVRDGAVIGDGQVWLQLGEVHGGMEPVAFERGRFRMADPSLAANPVVRVTASGAAAYAAHQGQRLPTAEEWALAAGAFPGQAAGRAEQDAGESLPVGLPPENGLGLRGLEGNVREWAALDASGGSARTARRIADASRGRAFVVMGDAGAQDGPSQSVGKRHGNAEACAPLPRQPWEAFEDVGFRTAMAVGQIAGNVGQPGAG